MTLFLQILCAAGGTVGFSVLFNVPHKYYPFCAVTGGMGWLVYGLLDLYSFSLAASVFFAAATVVLLSRIFSVWRLCPVNVFLIPGIFPLVPGSSVYWTTYYLVTGDGELAAKNAMDALIIVLAIVFAIAVILQIPGKLFHPSGWKRKNHL